MARPRNTDAPDLTQPVNLSVGVIERLACPAGKAQAFLRDASVPGLRVRVTPTGAKAYVFERSLDNRTMRRTIGSIESWTIEQARTEARRLAVQIDQGVNPNEQGRQQRAERDAEAAAEVAQAVTVGEVWIHYIEARRPRWGERHLADHERFMAPGGAAFRRGEGTTNPGILRCFTDLRLADLTPDLIEGWAQREGKVRPTSARLALRLLRAFLAWCKEHPRYSALVPDANPARTRRAREALGRATPKTDALLREQLPAWFAAVGTLPPTTAAFLRCLLLLGCRLNELLPLRWDDVNAQWRGITIGDKVEGLRVVPLTPYVHRLIAGLPRRNEYVFSSATLAQPMAYPHKPHAAACTAAGIEHLTLHGLRRSFGSLSEWLELPAGVVAQIMGHKPSATAEKHYRVRPLDLLRVHHERLEGWILEQAGVVFDATLEPGKLRAIV